MRALFLALLAVTGASLVAGTHHFEPGWQAGTLYEYSVETRTMVGLEPPPTQFSGVLTIARLRAQVDPSDPHQLNMEIMDMRTSPLLARLPGNWDKPVPDDFLNWRSRVFNKHFSVKLSSGKVTQLLVESGTSSQDVNYIRAVASALQISVGDYCLSNSPRAPNHLMEESPMGKCLTNYNVGVLPTYMVQAKPCQAPAANLDENANFLEIVKTIDFDNCKISREQEWIPGRMRKSNEKGPVTRSASTRVVVAGSLCDGFQMHSAVATSRVSAGTLLRSPGRVSVAWGRVNVTLHSIKENTHDIVAPPSTLTNVSLTYQMDYILPEDLEVRSPRQRSYSYNVNETITPEGVSRTVETEIRVDLVDIPPKIFKEYVETLKKAIEDSTAQKATDGRILSKREDQTDQNNSYDENEDEQKFHRIHTLNSSMSKSHNSTRLAPSFNSILLDYISWLQNNYTRNKRSSSDKTDTWENLVRRVSDDEAHPQFDFQKENIKNEMSDQLLKYQFVLDAETILALTTDPTFLGDIKICPEQVIIDTAKQIAADMNKPGTLVRRHTLQRFGEMVRLVRGCRYDQLFVIGNTLRSLDSASLQTSSWKAFRDATATAGSGAALVILRSWLLEGVVSGWEARQLVATLRGSVRFPSENYVNYLIENFLHDEKISMMDGVNTTVAMTIGSLTYDLYVQKKPVSYVLIILAQHLQKAIQANDTQRMQVYARAVGLTGNPMVPNVFSSFLMGRQPSGTVFLRTAMVVAMQRAAALHPEVAGPALYNIFVNTAEAYEVRVASVFILLSARPSLTTLQRMVATANSDPSENVAAAVISALKAAADLKDPAHKHLARNARSALRGLKPRTHSLHYSRSNLKDYLVFGGKGMGYFQTFNYIGSEDHILPKLFYFGMNPKMGGLKFGSTEIAYMLSSVSKLIDTLYGIEKDEGFVKLKQYSPSAFINNLGPRVNEPLEGHILFPLFGSEQFVSFNKEYLHTSSQDIMGEALRLIFGKDVHNSKYYYGPRYSYASPDITGHLTFFNFDEVNLVHSAGHIREAEELIKVKAPRGELEDATLTGMNLNMNLQYGNALTSRFGFVCFFDEEPKRYVAAYDQEYEYNLPVNASVGFLSENHQPLHPAIYLQPSSDQKTTLLRFMSTPYTAVQNPTAQGPGDETEVLVLNVREPREVVTDFGINESFQLNLTSEGEYLDSVQSKIQHSGYDFWTFFFLPIVYTNIEKVDTSITFNPQRAKIDRILFTWLNKVKDGSSHLESLLALNPAIPRKFPNFGPFDNRWKTSGNDSMIFEAGFYISFDDKFAAHVLESDYETDFVGKHEKMHLRYFYGESSDTSAQKSQEELEFNTELRLNISGKWGDAPRYLFYKALLADPTSHLKANLSFDSSDRQRMDINMTCNLQRTPERVNLLKSDRLAAVCHDQMAKGDMLLPACINVTLRAGYLDRYRCEALYDHLDPAFVSLAEAVYMEARRLLSTHANENPLHEGRKGAASAEVRFKEGFHAVSVALRTPSLAAEFEDIRMTRLGRPFVVTHPRYALFDRVAQYLLNYENEPKCVVDKNYVNTFSNRTYNIKLGACWRNITMVSSMFQNKKFNFTIQTRDINNKRLLRIFFLPEKSFELRGASQMSASVEHKNKETAPIFINGKPHRISKHKPLSLDLMNNGQNIQNGEHFNVDISWVTGNIFQINLSYLGVRILFDGVRIIIYLPNSYRSQILGLCGTFSGEKTRDLEDVDRTFQRDPLLFAASYANVNDDCEVPVKDEYEKWKQITRFQNEIMVYDVVGQSWINDAKLINDAKMLNDKCKSKFVDVVKNGTHVCFSQQILSKCVNSCQSTEYENLTIKYHCIKGSLGKFWESIINDGGLPDFSRKTTSMTGEKRVPKECKDIM